MEFQGSLSLNLSPHVLGHDLRTSHIGSEVLKVIRAQERPAPKQIAVGQNERRRVTDGIPVLSDTAEQAFDNGDRLFIKSANEFVE